MSNLNLPSLDAYRDLKAEQISEFQTLGHITLPNVLQAEEMTVYREVINEAAYRYNTEKRSLTERDTYGKAFLQIMNLWELDQNVRKFTLSKRLGKIAADLLGVDNVRIYHDQALYKEPGGGITPWHQDQYYWPVDTDKTITMWMPLIDITEEMGMLTFASRSQEMGFIENLKISDESESLFDQLIRVKGLEKNRPMFMNAGDASWHYGWTLHSAPPNLSQDTTREVMTIIYVSDGARITVPHNKHQENDRQRWLGGMEPGQLVGSKLNPLLL